MLVLDWMRWWYGPGWLKLANRSFGLIKAIGLSFSVPLLLRTLFAPWKRIISSSGNSVIDGLRALLDNLISRCVGLAVRVLTLLAATFCMVIAGAVSLAALLVWPFLPLAAIALIIRGLLPW